MRQAREPPLKASNNAIESWLDLFLEFPYHLIFPVPEMHLEYMKLGVRGEYQSSGKEGSARCILIGGVKEKRSSCLSLSFSTFSSFLL